MSENAALDPSPGPAGSARPRVHHPRCAAGAPLCRPDAGVHRAREREGGARGVHHRAHRPDHDRPLPPRLRRRDARPAGRAVRRSGALGVDDAILPLGGARRAGARLHRRHRIPAADGRQLRPRDRGHQVPALAARRRGAAHLQLHGHDLLSRRRRADADRQGALGLPHALLDVRLGLARDDRPPLPRRGLGGPARRHSRQPGPAQGAAGAADVRRDCRRAVAGGRKSECSVPARGAGRVAAVRGLRALPLHPGRDQELDADAVRDRVPARLRGRQPRGLRPPPAGVRAGGGRGRPGAGHRALPVRRGRARRGPPSAGW